MFRFYDYSIKQYARLLKPAVEHRKVLLYKNQGTQLLLQVSHGSWMSPVRRRKYQRHCMTDIVKFEKPHLKKHKWNFSPEWPLVSYYFFLENLPLLSQFSFFVPLEKLEKCTFLFLNNHLSKSKVICVMVHLTWT